MGHTIFTPLRKVAATGGSVETGGGGCARDSLYPLLQPSPSPSVPPTTRYNSIHTCNNQSPLDIKTSAPVYVPQPQIMYLSPRLCTSAPYYVPQPQIMYLSTILCTSAPDYVPQHHIMYLSPRLCTSAPDYVPQPQIMYLSTILCTSAPDYVPQYDT
ncbi:hypothetical protein J6590_064143 [Homalodisca vitripennis]|nr:hypothetical protein J6590_064143 [Homalodisca vitripennis]